MTIVGIRKTATNQKRQKRIITLTSKEVLWLFGIENTTLECWIENKVLSPCRVTPHGEKLFLREDVVDLLCSFGA